MKKIEKVQTAILPTPLHKMENLTKQVGLGDLYIKRDDMTGFAMGGNKLRKLDYVVKYCLDNGYTTILTQGGPQTNHGRLTAAACAKYGLKCILFLLGKPSDYMSGNQVLDRMMGADIYYSDMSRYLSENKDKPFDVQVKEYKEIKNGWVKEVVDKYEANGEKVYDLPIGGHTLEGVLGYVDCVEEVMEQMKTQNIKIDYLVVGNGSGGTLSGLLLGAKYHNAPFKIISANISKKSDKEMQGIVDFANQTSEKFDMGVTVTLEDLHYTCNDHVGPGYNVPDEETRKVMYRLASAEGILTDPCYTGKSFASFLDLVEKGEVIPKGSSAVFLHTGGVPGIYTKEHLDAMQEELWKIEKSYAY